MDDDTLLRLAALIIHEDAAEEYESLTPAEDNVPDSQEIQRQLANVLRKHRRQKWQSRLRILPGTVLHKAAAVIAALSVLGGGVTATVVATNPQIRNQFVTDFKEYTSITTIFSNNMPEIPEEWDAGYYPTYMPRGFAYMQMIDTPDIKELIYRNDEGVLGFSVCNEGTSLSINTENMLMSSMEINGTQSIVYVNELDTRTIIVMNYTNSVVCIGGPIPSSEAILIAESVLAENNN